MAYSENHKCKCFHTLVVCLVLHLSMASVKSHESFHAPHKYAMWKKKGVFWKVRYTSQLSLFKPNSLNKLWIYTCSWLCEYTEPCVKVARCKYTVFFYSDKFRDRDDVGACCNIAIGACCNTLTVEQIGRILGWIVPIVIQAPKLAWDISTVIKYILSDW